MAEAYTVRGEGQTVELVLHRKFGVPGRALVAETLRINPGLAGLGPFLPLNTTFTVPDLPAQTTPIKARKSLFRD